MFILSLSYVLATGVTIEEYEKRIEEFNIHGCWEWSNGVVLIHEFPSTPHEVCIGAIVKKINITSCSNADGTNSEIYSFGSTSKYQCHNVLLCLWHRINFYFLKERVTETVEKKPMHSFVR